MGGHNRFVVREHALKGKARRSGSCDTRFVALLLASCAGCLALGGLVGYAVDAGWSQKAELATEGFAAQVKRSVMAAVSSSTHMCSDTCYKAKDGICDDGRFASHSQSMPVHCDIGTDCSDCGPWKGSPGERWGGNAGPVEFAHRHNIQMFAKQTVTRPAFLMPITSIQNDSDVSSLIDNSGLIESGITQIFHELLKDRCIKPDGSRALVVDVGANFGYFTLYAAMHGCRVISVEPIPSFRALLKYGLQLNNLTHLVTLHDKVVSDRSGVEMTMAVPTTGNWGTASMASELSSHMPDARANIKVTSTRLDDIVAEDVLLMKVDVEGYEAFVFKSAQRLLKEHNVENIIMEYTPGLAEALFLMYKQTELLDENPQMFKTMMDAGYRITHLHDNFAKSGYAPAWESGLPPMAEVSAEVLKYDFMDISLLKQRKLGCPTPPELSKYKGWSTYPCDALPEAAHPKSLRSMFHFNTNLWATKNRTMQPVLAYAGTFALNQDMKAMWTSAKSAETAIGGRVCPYLEPWMLVRNRCSCSWASKASQAEQDLCLEEEVLVKRLLAEGKMPAREP